MKRSRHQLALILLLVASCAAASGQTRYTVSLADRERHLLRVVLKPAPQPDLQVQLPVWYALYEVRDFSQYVRWVQARDASGNAVEVRKLDKTTWSAPNAAEIEYEIAAELPPPFGAQANAEHVFLNPAEVLIYAVGQREQPIEVQFQGVPANWRIATALAQVANTTAAYSAKNYDQLADSPLEIGTFQETSFDQDGMHYSVVVDADPGDYDLKAIAEMDRKIAAAETAWMDDRPFDHYVFIYHFPRGRAGGGMEHAYSTAISHSGLRLKDEMQMLASTTAHELFHAWNVKRIRPQSLEPIDYTRENYTPALWFSEGVTSTVADFIMVRAGMMDEDGFLRRLARQIQAVEDSPAHLTQSPEESSLDTWLEKYPYYNRPDRSVSYYASGEIRGMLLDLAIREATNGRQSLRDVFHWMNGQYARQGRFFPDSAGVRQAAEAVSHADLKSFFEDYVAGVKEPPYDRYFATVGLKLQQKTVNVPDAGFTVAQNFGQAPVVVTLDPNSDAARAGVASGDIVQQLNGQPVEGSFERLMARMQIGDSVRLRVSRRGGSREVTFKLGGREEEQYALVDADNVTRGQRRRRSAWIRGESEPPTAQP